MYLDNILDFSLDMGVRGGGVTGALASPVAKNSMFYDCLETHIFLLILKQKVGFCPFPLKNACGRPCPHKFVNKIFGNLF